MVNILIFGRKPSHFIPGPHSICFQKVYKLAKLKIDARDDVLSLDLAIFHSGRHERLQKITDKVFKKAKEEI